MNDVNSDGFASRARSTLLRYRRSDGRTVGEEDIPRFTETLRLIGGISPSPQRVCDVGTFGGLEPALIELFGIREIITTGSMDSPEGGELVFLDKDGREAIRFPHHRFDLEDAFPLPDGSRDLVVFTEVLEHLSRDPMHTMSELNRITHLGGWLVLTTPNCACLNSVLKALRGDHPYNWSAYSRAGDRDRHNREYTPSEVVALVKAAGYEIVSCSCVEVYDKQGSWPRRLAKWAASLVLSSMRRLLVNRDRAGWVGEVTFVLARKSGPVTERKPSSLYY